MNQHLVRPLALSAVVLLGASALRATTEITGPSTVYAPYLAFDAAFAVANPNATLTAIRAVEDGTTNGLPQMVGIPDGAGAFDNGDGTFTLLVNQELSSGGKARAHGATGAFVSKWVIRKSDLAVLSLSDLSQKVATWNTTTGAHNPAATTTTAWSRFCSATVPAVSALHNAATGKGTTARVIMNGEESGNAGKAWLHVASGPEAGTSYQLAHLGRLSFENAGACPFPQDTTIVISQDDTSGGNGGGGLYVYVGQKRSTGNEAEKAGLVGGTTYGIQVGSGGNEAAGTGSSPVSGVKGASVPFNLVSLGDVSAATTTGTMVNGAALTWFARPEDGCWDARPAYKNDYYFVCTASTTTRSRLYRLRFNDIANPAAGGQITCLIDGTEGHLMFDNLTVGVNGKIYLQEDIGGNNNYGKIWEYDTATGNLVAALQFKSSLFAPGGTTFNNDEEASGIFDASDIFGPGRYLFVAQAHTTTTGYPIPAQNNGDNTAAVEHGQILLLTIPAKAEVTRGAVSYNRAKTVAIQSFTVKNTDSVPLAGPVKLAFVGLPAGTTVVNAAGTTTVGAQTAPYVNASASALAAGASAAIGVQFSVTGNSGVSCEAVVAP